MTGHQSADPTIRAFQPGDVGVVADLHVRSWRTTYRGILDDIYLDGAVVQDRLEVWSSRFSNPSPDHIGLLAISNRTPVGFAFAFSNHDPVWGALLDNLHVVPEGRRHGIGTKLICALAERLSADRRSKGIHLWVFDKNVRSRTYYERLGASVVERQEAPAPGGGVVAEWLYAWRAVEDLHRAAVARLRSGVGASG
jgi:ribosomal protein S18 acetylase RimI-like enzyme